MRFGSGRFGAVLLWMVVLAVGLMFGAGARAQQANSGQGPFLTALGTLTSAGYTVTAGNTGTFQSCAPYVAAFGTCFGDNPSSPYIFVQPPVTSTNYLPTYAQAPPFQVGNTSQLYQLAADEAIVTIITLPPISAYFSLQTYMVERSAAYYTASPPMGSTCVGGTRYPDQKSGPYTETADCNFVMFGFFANAVNNADFINSGLPEWNTWSPAVGTQAGSPSTSTTVAVITTGNSTLATKLQAAFVAAGANAGTNGTGQIFVEPMPAATCPSGSLACVNTCVGNVAAGGMQTQPCDLFATLIRETLPEYSPNATAWEALGLPANYPNILVYRVELASRFEPGTLITPTAVHNSINGQGCNTNETLAGSEPTGCAGSVNFDADLQTVAQKLISDLGTLAGVTYSMPQANGSIVGGPGCIVNGTNCAGGSEDNDSYRTLYMTSLEDQVPTFVVGLLHSASPADFTTPTPLENARYTSVDIADNQTNQNVGVVAAAEPNFSTEYVPPTTPQIPLSGSALAVLEAFATTNAVPESVRNELPNIYIHVFYRFNPGQESCKFIQICGGTTTPVWATIIQNGSLTQNMPGSPNYIPLADEVSFTERGYVLSPSPPGAALTGSNLTGALAPFLDSPYVVCDSAVCGN